MRNYGILQLDIGMESTTLVILIKLEDFIEFASVLIHANEQKIREDKIFRFLPSLAFVQNIDLKTGYNILEIEIFGGNVTKVPVRKTVFHFQ